MAGKIRVAILVEDFYQDLEVWYPLLRLKEEGFEVVTVEPNGRKEYKGKNGYSIVVDKSIDQVKPADFDAVVIPGGWAPDSLRRSEEVVDFVRGMDKKGKLVAGICHAGWVLVSAGILQGRKATCFSGIKDDVVNAGAEFIDKEVVVDKNLVTARTPYDLPAFLREIIKFLKRG